MTRSIAAFFPSTKTGKVDPNAPLVKWHDNGIISIKFGICHKFFSPQGYKNHMRYHNAAEETTSFPYQRVKPNGQVKIRGNPYPRARMDVCTSVELSGVTNATDQDVAMSVSSDDKDNAGQPEAGTSSRNGKSGLRDFTIAEKIEILDFHEKRNKDSEHGYAATVTWVKRQFKRPTFSRQSLKYILYHAKDIRAQRGTKTKVKERNTGVREGRFPKMELDLAKSIRQLRSIGIPVHHGTKRE